MCATHVRARVKMTKLCRLCPAPLSAASDRYADTRRYLQAAAAVCQNAQQQQQQGSHMQTAAEWHGKCLAQCKVSERYKKRKRTRRFVCAASCPAQMPFAYHNINNINNNNSHRECCKNFRLISSTINQKIKSNQNETQQIA